MIFFTDHEHDLLDATDHVYGLCSLTANMIQDEHNVLQGLITLDASILETVCEVSHAPPYSCTASAESMGGGYALTFSGYYDFYTIHQNNQLMTTFM